MGEHSERVIRRATEEDLPHIAGINAEVFLGDRDRPESAQTWATRWFSAFPLYQYFVAEIDGRVVGYAGWQAHGGFHRAEPVFELDQLGISKSGQGKGIGPDLIRTSMRTLVDWTKETNDRIESHVAFVVWVDALNFNAISVYARIFTDGICGFRLQFGNRAENMLRCRYPVFRPVRSES